ncbi:uncharacterized protein (TIGR03083 family) [Nakamurella sp. UYEF19]|uniref:maleylpyruvate isomerase family mycothiol-dependent enzyme n=1 Tax=Nakamurella sp. UYEF19 TaxID=1756392 RepID=UPI003394AB17
MPTSMSYDEHLAVIRHHSAALLADATRSSMSDVVPTCPGWTVADLLKHHGGVCRWAASISGGARTNNLTNAELDDVMTAPKARKALLAWYAEGAGQLVTALETAPDGPALVFLRDAPSPREFWARRSAHETTVHRVDALSAQLGRLPTAASTDITTGLAVDGIDELLLGFLPRPSSNLRVDEPIVVNVTPTDSQACWNIVISTDPPVTATGVAPEADATLTGSAVGLYLGLWNRGDEIAEHGLAPVLGLWRERVRVSWT